MVEQFYADTRSLAPQEILLGMDNHGAQQTLKFRQELALKNIHPAYTPPDCTDLVSPCDHHVGKALKDIMAIFYHKELEENREQWCGNGLSRSERRMKMAVWAAAAWGVVAQNAAFLRSSFVSTGFLIAKDGSEDGLIKIPDYSF